RGARAEGRQVDVSGGAASRGARETALLQLPLHRRGAGVDLRIERHPGPGAEVVAVVPLARRPGRTPEIREIGRGARRVVVVNPGRGTGARFVTTPGGRVAVGEVG